MWNGLEKKGEFVRTVNEIIQNISTEPLEKNQQGEESSVTKQEQVEHLFPVVQRAFTICRSRFSAPRFWQALLHLLNVFDCAYSQNFNESQRGKVVEWTDAAVAEVRKEEVAGDSLVSDESRRGEDRVTSFADEESLFLNESVGPPPASRDAR
eukprot:TRINITY_DN168898_c0_g1_i1.p1 TRINITY_DN168898_c0_g1~~TRINITY_DN168898_c0_g1_i1.p1  ORF type:complete len:153 (-),score=20.45 TRINITY_DN168898_c0_g1_i1:371-829(-)